MIEKSNISSLWPALFDPLRDLGARVADWVAPRAEAKGAEDGYEITVELPGVAMENIKVSAEDGALTIRGEKRSERTEKDEGKTWFFTEREYGAFMRSFRMPADADQSGVAASFKDGVLTLRIPKKKGAAPDGRSIQITAG